MNLVKNTSFYTLGALLPKIGAFIFLPIYLKYLTPTEYGIVNSLQVLSAVFIVLCTLSMPRALYRIYYDYKSTEEKKLLFGTIVISVFVLAIVSLLLIFLLQDQVQKIYVSINFFPYFTYAIATVFFLAFHTIPAVYLQIKEKATSFVSISIAMFFVKSVLVLWFIISFDRGAKGYLEAELITAILFTPVYYAFIYKDIVLKWNMVIFKNVIHFALPIIPSILSVWILNLSDRVFIERYFSTADVGIYSLGYQVAGLVLIFSIAFKKAYDPYFYKMANTESEEVAKKKLYTTNYIFVLILIFASFCISFFAKEAITIFFDDNYLNAIQIVPIISLAYLVSQNSALLNVMMYQQKKTKIVMFILIGSALLNIILNYLLIPRMGIIGAAYATLISFSSIFIFSYILAKKTYFVPYNWKGILPVVLFLFALYNVFVLIDVSNVYWSIMYKSLVVILLLGVIFFRFKSTIMSIIHLKK